MPSSSEKKTLKVKTCNLIFSKMESFLLCYRNVKLIKGWFFILNTTAVSFNHNENFDYFEFLYEFIHIFQLFSLSLVETCSLTNFPNVIHHVSRHISFVSVCKHWVIKILNREGMGGNILFYKEVSSIPLSSITLLFLIFSSFHFLCPPQKSGEGGGPTPAPSDATCLVSQYFHVCYNRKDFLGEVEKYCPTILWEESILNSNGFSCYFKWAFLTAFCPASVRPSVNFILIPSAMLFSERRYNEVIKYDRAWSNLSWSGYIGIDHLGCIWSPQNTWAQRILKYEYFQ